MRLLLDGAQVLGDDDGEQAIPGTEVLLKRSAYIRPDYHHIRQGNGLWNWFERRWQEANRFVYTITFPDGAEVTTFGLAEDRFPASRMGVVIKLGREPGLSGMCGNFNDNSRDDCHRCSRSRANRYVQMVAPTDIPDGFLEGAAGGALLQQQSFGQALNATADESADDYAQVRSNCSADLLVQADQRCADVVEEGIVENCVYDICVTGDIEFERDEHTLEILRLVRGNGVVTQEAEEGKCLDSLGRTYASLPHLSINTPQECRELLQELGNIDGVEGAQLGPSSNCEILYDADTDASNLLKHQQVLNGEQMWAERAEQPGGGGIELVGNSSGEHGWHCWKEM